MPLISLLNAWRCKHDATLISSAIAVAKLRQNLIIFQHFQTFFGGYCQRMSLRARPAAPASWRRT
jgi:hypothetical protein